MIFKFANLVHVKKISSHKITCLSCRLFCNWVYSDDGLNYCNNKIESRLKAWEGGSIDLNKDDHLGIGFLKINNPLKRNAFTGKMMCDLRTAVEELRLWNSGKAVILYGADHNYCSGADLSSFESILSPEDGEAMCMYMQNTLTEFQRLSLLTVAFIEGKALGGGAELATACDFRLMTEAAEMCFLHKTMGLIPGWGGLTRLVQLVGPQKAMQLLVSAEKINSKYALNMNLADKIVVLSQKDVFHEIDVRFKDETDADVQHASFAPDCSVHKAVDWLNGKFDLSNTDESVTRAIKQAIVACKESNSWSDSLNHEKELFKSLWGGEAHLQALSISRHIKKSL